MTLTRQISQVTLTLADLITKDRLCLLYPTGSLHHRRGRKLVLGPIGEPISNQAATDACFPLTLPDWDFNTIEVKRRLFIYCQALLAGLKAAASCLTNLARVYDIKQGENESLTAFLERVMEAFQQYNPMDPELPKAKATVALASINQARPIY